MDPISATRSATKKGTFRCRHGPIPGSAPEMVLNLRNAASSRSASPRGRHGWPDRDRHAL
jgi:hypothetical protein